MLSHQAATSQQGRRRAGTLGACDTSPSSSSGRTTGTSTTRPSGSRGTTRSVPRARSFKPTIMALTVTPANCPFNTAPSVRPNTPRLTHPTHHDSSTQEDSVLTIEDASTPRATTPDAGAGRGGGARRGDHPRDDDKNTAVRDSPRSPGGFVERVAHAAQNHVGSLRRGRRRHRGAAAGDVSRTARGSGQRRRSTGPIHRHRISFSSSQTPGRNDVIDDEGRRTDDGGGAG